MRNVGCLRAVSRLRLLLVVVAATGAAMACGHLAVAQAKTVKDCRYGTYCYAPPGWMVPGCASGYVCIYNGSTFASGVELRYYYYGIYNFHRMNGRHLIVNRQFLDRAEAPDVYLCSRYYGYGQEIGSVGMGFYQVENLTPVYSFIMGIPGDPNPPGNC